ncbi:MAG TPA: glycosyltransferase family 39 protein, partial [Abditibacteriaceae bacterium]
MTGKSQNAPATTNSSRWVLKGFVALYCVLTLLLVFRVPLGSAPDEWAHFKYVEHLATTQTLPVFKPIGAAKDPGYEFHQPPLYYALCAPLWDASGPGAQQYLCRLISLLFGAATVVLVWRSLRELWPDNRQLAALATGFAALLPMHQAVGASGGNDAIAGFFCALMFYRVACGTNRVWTLRDSVLLGVAIGLGMLSKTTCLVVAVAAFGSVCHFVLRDESNKKNILKHGGAVAGVALLVCGWWLLRNTRLYGDPFAMRIFDEAFRNSSPRPSAFMTDGVIFEKGVSLFTYLRALAL